MKRKMSNPIDSRAVAPRESERTLQSATLPCARATVLVVDDDRVIAEGYASALSNAGFDAVPLSSGAAALEILASRMVDAIVTDILMPGMDGVSLLHEIRKHDLDVPVILVTGNPSLESAVSAMQFGGFRYLSKPVDLVALNEVVADAVSLHRLARLKREALTLLALHQKQLGDRASLEVHFERALAQLWIAFQPIVDWKQRTLFGYEALVRSDEPTLGNPSLLLDAAERLGRVWDLGRKVRQLVARHLQGVPEGLMVFVNLHALDLGDSDLADPLAELSRHARRIVLEVTERTSLDDVSDVPEFIRGVRLLGYRIAVDDLGAGYAGLACFSRLEPDIAKLDMSLIRGIDGTPRLQSLVRSMLNVCTRELGIQVVCEGVETASERDMLDALGATLLQGNLFGRPAPAFPKVSFGARGA